MTADATLDSPAAVKQLELLTRDLAMTATAGKYDLDDPAEMARSCGDLTRLFFRLAAIFEVDLFVEAGAKDAATSRHACDVLSPKRVVAFEANPYTYQRFKRINRDAGNVEYFHRALTDSPVDHVTFHVLRNDQGKPRADGQSSLLKRDSDLEKGFIEAKVAATTLDTFFADESAERSALWVDVEGASSQVLAGGRQMLDRAAIVMIEVENRRYWGDAQWLSPEVMSYLYDRGLVPVARDFQSRFQYNIVFVRAGLLAVDRIRWELTRFASSTGQRKWARRVRKVTAANVAKRGRRLLSRSDRSRH